MATSRSHGLRRAAPCVLAIGMAVSCHGASAQEYSRYLTCTGSFAADGKSAEANAEFALRYTNRSALIQGSNVLPVGEILRYVPTPMAYTMTYLLKRHGTDVVVVPGWFQNTILVGYPNLKRLNQIRLSIDRRSGVLDGKMLNEEDELLASFTMQCQSQSEQELGPPKF